MKAAWENGYRLERSAFATTARHAVKGRAEVTRFKGRFSELIVALIKLAALQVRLGTIATEAAWTFHSKVIQSIGAGIGRCNRQSPKRNRCGCACH
jgi:hypothetical protein